MACGSGSIMFTIPHQKQSDVQVELYQPFNSQIHYGSADYMEKKDDMTNIVSCANKHGGQKQRTC